MSSDIELNLDYSWNIYCINFCYLKKDDILTCLIGAEKLKGPHEKQKAFFPPFLLLFQLLSLLGPAPLPTLHVPCNAIVYVLLVRDNEIIMSLESSTTIYDNIYGVTG